MKIESAYDNSDGRSMDRNCQNYPSEEKSGVYEEKKEKRERLYHDHLSLL